MENYIKILFKEKDEEQRGILIAELSDEGYSFEESEDLAAYIEEGKFDDAKLCALIGDRQFEKSVIENTNWNEQWESEFQPVTIKSVRVRAAFHEKNGAKHDIIITPKMSFGTAHHPTTALMISEMLEMDLKKKSVLDFGTGTGVLAILAERLGAEKVIAIDNDEWSITNAKENLVSNKTKKVQLLQKDHVEGLGEFDLILANINLNVILYNLLPLKNCGKSGSKILLSGFLASDVNNIERATRQGFIVEKVAKLDDWAAVLLSLP